MNIGRWAGSAAAIEPYAVPVVGRRRCRVAVMVEEVTCSAERRAPSWGRCVARSPLPRSRRTRRTSTGPASAAPSVARSSFYAWQNAAPTRAARAAAAGAGHPGDVAQHHRRLVRGVGLPAALRRAAAPRRRGGRPRGRGALAVVFYNVGAIVGYLTSGFVADLLGRPGADRADLSASGFFTTDHAVMFTQQSAHGRIHGLLGAVVFLVMPTCCFLLAARSRRDARPRRWRSSTLGWRSRWSSLWCCSRWVRSRPSRPARVEGPRPTDVPGAFPRLAAHLRGAAHPHFPNI